MSRQIIEKIIYNIIKKRKSFSIIVREFGLDDEEQIMIIELLIKDGYVPSSDGEYFFQAREYVPDEKSFYKSFAKRHYRICCLSDTHLVSIYDRIDVLNTIYERGEKDNIDFFLHSGDFYEGLIEKNKYPNKVLRETDIYKQVDYAVNNYPKSRVNTYVIGGNHDEETLRRNKIDLIEELSNKRKEIIFLGQNQANLQIGDLRILMIHGTTRKIERKIILLKKEINLYKENTAPQLIVTGHTHEAMYFTYLYSHIFQCPSLVNCQDPDLFKDRKTNNGVWWIEFDLDEQGNIEYLKQELQTFPCEYVKKLY